jgi:apolipoprotein D and lipocalin family protein
VRVLNTAKFGNQSISIVGTAAPADAHYGADGVFRVSFPGSPGPECPGPNYIVQGASMGGRGKRVFADVA